MRRKQGQRQLAILPSPCCCKHRGRCQEEYEAYQIYMQKQSSRVTHCTGIYQKPINPEELGCSSLKTLSV